LGWATVLLTVLLLTAAVVELIELV